MKRISVADAMTVYTHRDPPSAPVGPDAPRTMPKKQKTAISSKTVQRISRKTVKEPKAEPLTRLTFALPFDIVDLLMDEKKKRRRAAGRFRGAGADYSTLVADAVRKVYSPSK
jgi:hypothetical protein